MQDPLKSLKVYLLGNKEDRFGHPVAQSLTVWPLVLSPLPSLYTAPFEKNHFIGIQAGK